MWNFSTRTTIAHTARMRRSINILPTRTRATWPRRACFALISLGILSCLWRLTFDISSHRIRVGAISVICRLIERGEVASAPLDRTNRFYRHRRQNDRRRLTHRPCWQSFVCFSFALESPPTARCVLDLLGSLSFFRLFRPHTISVNVNEKITIGHFYRDAIFLFL